MCAPDYPFLDEASGQAVLADRVTGRERRWSELRDHARHLGLDVAPGDDQAIAMALTDLLPVVNDVPLPRTRPLWVGFAVCDEPSLDDGQRWIVDQIADLITDFVLRAAPGSRLVLDTEEELRTHNQPVLVGDFAVPISPIPNAGVQVFRQLNGRSRICDYSVSLTYAIGLRRRSP